MNPPWATERRAAGGTQNAAEPTAEVHVLSMSSSASDFWMGSNCLSGSACEASSLSSAIFDDLHGQNAQLFGSAAATSMLTIIGVVILLTPVLIRTWREFSRKGV